MKTSKSKMILLTAMIAAGSLGLQAQYGRGAQYLRNQRGACVNTPGLTVEQQKAIQELSGKHMAEMDALRTQFWSTTNPQEAAAIRTKMDLLQATHRNTIVELGSVTPNVPRSAYRGGSRGLGRGAGVGIGRGAGRGAALGYGRGMGRGAGGAGRGLGPCGGGLGPIR